MNRNLINPQALNRKQRRRLEKQAKEQARRTGLVARPAIPAQQAQQMAKAQMLHQDGLRAEAEALLNQMVAINPSDAEAWNLLGVMKGQSEDIDAARQMLARAIQARPDYADAYSNLAIIEKNAGQFEVAKINWHKCLELAPDHTNALMSLYENAIHICDWDETAKLKPRVDKFTRDAIAAGRRALESPFASITICDDEAHNLAVARSWSQLTVRRMKSATPTFDFSGRRQHHQGPLRIGYLSGDFRNHPVSHLTAGMFGCHDRSAFEIYAFSYGVDDGSEYRQRIASDCDEFIDVHNLGHREVAAEIYRRGIDILVDLAGYTQGSRLVICSLRPAPVQVTYLGFPGSTGADFIDYCIVDPIVVPVGHAGNYSESLVWMPHCYQVNDDQKTTAAAARRSAHGLPDQGFVFASFNGTRKLEPVMFDAWMKILAAVPGSVLWLFANNKPARDNLRRAATARGIDADRLVFAAAIAKPEHLARLSLADLGLDTRIYNGHTTTSDMLWMGLPVVTMQGQHFASRVSASILAAIGMEELITRNIDDYCTLAIRLATNPDDLATIRARLQENRQTSSLFDTSGFTRNLESAYHIMWDNWCGGGAPGAITVKVP